MRPSAATVIGATFGRFGDGTLTSHEPTIVRSTVTLQDPKLIVIFTRSARTSVAILVAPLPLRWHRLLVAVIPLAHREAQLQRAANQLLER